MAGLSGMKEITEHTKRSESTILKWVREYDFPAAKIDGCWESDTEEIAGWRKKMINGGSTLKTEPKPAKTAGRKKAVKVT